MPTPAERQALLFVAAVAALGIGVRGVQAMRGAPPEPGSRAALSAQIARVDSAIAQGGARRGKAEEARSVRPVRARREAGRRETIAPGPPALSAPGAESAWTPRARPSSSRVEEPDPARPVDVDIATAEELDRLPGIGPALAKRIVEDRERHGAFGSLEALDRVRGIGPALTERLRPHVTFSHPPRPPDTEAPAAARWRHP